MTDGERARAPRTRWLATTSTMLVVWLAIGGLRPLASDAATSGLRMTVSPRRVTLPTGGGATTVTIETASTGSKGTLQFAVAKLPAGVTAAFSSDSAPIGSPVTLALGIGAPVTLGSYRVGITAIDPSGSSSVSASITVKIRRPKLDPNLTAALTPLLSKVKGEWQSPLPPACPATPSCLVDLSNLPMPPGLQRAVLSTSLPLVPLTYEVMRFPLTEPLRCDAEGHVHLAGLTGEADGPYPGPVTLDTGSQFWPDSFFRGGFALRIYLPGIDPTSNVGVVTTGTLLDFGCNRSGVHQGAMGSFEYQAPLRSGSDVLGDAGTAVMMVSAPHDRDRSLIITFFSSNLTGVSLPPPTPIEP